MDNIFNDFKIPITYTKNKKKINDNLLSDLELINGIDDNKPIYHYIFNPNNSNRSKC